MGEGLRLGQISGVPVFVSRSWIGLFVLATAFMAFFQLPQVFPDIPVPLLLFVGLAFSVLFFGSVFVHEFAHALVAQSSGMRVTGISLHIFGGATTFESQQGRAGTEAWIAAAGPLTSLLLGMTFFLVFFQLGGQSSPLGIIAGWLARINLLLGVINILPGLPLDGGRVFQAIVWRATGDQFRGTIAATSAGQILGIFNILLGLFLISQNEVAIGAWFFLIGWFLRRAALASRKSAARQEALKDRHVRDAMDTEWPRVQASLGVRTLGEDDDFVGGRQSYLVYDRDEWVGIIPVRVVKALDVGEQSALRVSDLMVHRDEVVEVFPDDDMSAVYAAMELGRIGYAPVQDEGRVVGVIARDAILKIAEDNSPLRRKSDRADSRKR